MCSGSRRVDAAPRCASSGGERQVSRQWPAPQGIQSIATPQCLDTLANALQGRSPEAGFQFIAVCSSECFDGPPGSVYGNTSYALESVICFAGLHAGICSKGAACELFVTVTGPQKEFAAVENNGVASRGHGSAEKSMALAHASCTHSLIHAPPIKLKIHFGAPTAPLPQVTVKAFASAGLPAVMYVSSTQTQGWLGDDGGVKKRRGRYFFGSTDTQEGCRAAPDE